MAETKAKKTESTKKASKKKESISKGRIYLNTTYNNTIITFTNEFGDVKAWSSAGIAGFKGSRRSTPFAGQKAAEDLNNKIQKFALKEVDIFINGAGVAKQLALRELGNGGYKISTLIDNTPVRFGGTKPRKKPRK